MDQHPIPQNITGFEFKLIGEMTIKQFAYLAGCAVVAFITYSLGIHPFIKFPLIVLFAMLGIGLAFIPIEGRPLDRWITNFIRALFAANQYLFHQQGGSPEFLNAPVQSIKSVAASQAKSAHTLSMQAKQPEKFTAYLQTVRPATQIDTEEQKRLAAIEQLTKTMPAPAPVSPPQAATLTTPVPPAQSPPDKPAPVLNQTDTAQDALAIEQRLHAALAEKERLASELAKLRQQVSASNAPQAVTPMVAPAPQQAYAPPTGVSTLPQIPNLVAGSVKDSKGDVLPNVIVEVKDASGNPVRAFKTNKLGQFSASTSLANGSYTIALEDPKNTYMFDAIGITLTGAFFQPIEIRAKDPSQNEREKLHAALFGRRNPMSS